MRGYGQFCPIAKASEILAERWTPLVLRELLCGSTRFNDLQRGVPLMSRGLLSKRLKELERAGVIRREPLADGQAHEYLLTPAGEELRPLIMGLGEWGQRWARTAYTPDDLDPTLLMWDIRRSIEVDRLPERRVVAAFAFQDVEKTALRRIWLVFERPHVDVCFKDPGFPVDLTIETTLRTMSMVWMGDRSLGECLREGEVRIYGARELRERFGDWLKLSAFADVARP